MHPFWLLIPSSSPDCQVWTADCTSSPTVQQSLVAMVRTMSHKHLCSQNRSGHLGWSILRVTTWGQPVATCYTQLWRERATTSRRSHTAHAKQPVNHKQMQPTDWGKTVAKTGLLLPKQLIESQHFPALQPFIMTSCNCSFWLVLQQIWTMEVEYSDNAEFKERKNNMVKYKHIL